MWPSVSGAALSADMTPMKIGSSNFMKLLAYRGHVTRRRSFCNGGSRRKGSFMWIAQSVKLARTSGVAISFPAPAGSRPIEWPTSYAHYTAILAGTCSVTKPASVWSVPTRSFQFGSKLGSKPAGINRRAFRITASSNAGSFPARWADQPEIAAAVHGSKFQFFPN
jgi:hypothetical protein